jgi:hypothetical protein
MTRSCRRSAETALILEYLVMVVWAAAFQQSVTDL